MGAARKRRERFFADHPTCCFCGGESPATTIDHVPLRAAFVGNVGPEGFEFPACDDCNGGTAASEQVLALYARLFDRNDKNYDAAHVQKLIAGIRNNYPALLPRTDLSAIEKRKILRTWGWAKPDDQFLDDVGLVALPKVAAVHIAVNTVKLLAALSYRHRGLVLSSAHGVFTMWSQQGLPGVDEAQKVLFDGMPELVVGERVNTSIGDQFAYRLGYGGDPAGLFGFAAGFGAGLFIVGAAAPWDTVQDHGDWHQYEPPRSPAA